jgi:HPt (histidine-containing phosphotransfer) domain-containing protein
MDDYVTKPIRVEELQAALERWGQMVTQSTESLSTSNSELSALNKLIARGDVKFALDLITLFSQSAADLMTDLRAAIAQPSAHALVVAAHTLKGSSAELGAQTLAALCGEMERLARANQIDQAQSLLAELDAEFVRVCAACDSLRTRL